MVCPACIVPFAALAVGGAGAGTAMAGMSEDEKKKARHRRNWMVILGVFLTIISVIMLLWWCIRWFRSKKSGGKCKTC